MSLAAKDREFRLPKISYLEFKQVEMDRVLTGLFARLQHNGYSNRLRRRKDITTDAFVEEFMSCPEIFANFAQHPDIVRRWTETHLLDLVNRGRATENVAAPRPLHGYTYLFRNPNHCRDYGAAQHIYEVLYSADGGSKALEHLKSFFFPGVDAATGKEEVGITIDVETQALLRLSKKLIQDDLADMSVKRESYQPLLQQSADTMAEDILRLLAYQSFIPRSVMVEYIKILLAFHLALYHLRLFKLLPDLVRRQGVRVPDQEQIGILVDIANIPGTPIAQLAEQSADIHYRRIPAFVRAHYAVKKMDQFVSYLSKQPGKAPTPERGYFSVEETLAYLGSQVAGERNPYFKQRMAGVLDGSNGEGDELPPELQAILDLELPPFETYVEIVASIRGPYYRRYITETMDSLLLKNRPGAVLGQQRASGSRRRFILDSRLLEVLIQIAVLRPTDATGFVTCPMRIDELLEWFRKRYGIHIDCLPQGDGWEETGISELRALRDNAQAFRRRLREIGFYEDLSDAYITQVVSPRYEIAETVKEGAQ